MKKNLILLMICLCIAFCPASDIVAAANKNPVQKITVTAPKKSKITLEKGKKYTIKVKVTASNKKYKKVTFQSNNKKIATVSKKGVIKAKKKGTAKITVQAVYGKKSSKTKKTIMVKVVNPKQNVTSTDAVESTTTQAPPPEQPEVEKDNLQSVSFPGDKEYWYKGKQIEITLNRPIELNASEINVFAGRYSAPSDAAKAEVESVEKTEIPNTYLIMLKEYYENGDYVTVEIPKLTGIKQLTTPFVVQNHEELVKKSVIGVKGEHVVQGYLSSKAEDRLQGRLTVTAQNLPEGIYLIENYDEYAWTFWEQYYEGTYKEVGTTSSVITVEDEYNNRVRYEVEFRIGDDTHIVAEGVDIYGTSGILGLFVKGGSRLDAADSYTFELMDTGDEMVKENCTIKLNNGIYTNQAFLYLTHLDNEPHVIKIKVSDRSNPDIYTILTIPYPETE